MTRRILTTRICLERAGEGRWKVWVHIADVSHYVKPGGALDEEARRRGNSTYLVDRVIPMLPEALSNELCSLKPGTDRLTKCVEFLLSGEGQVLNARFYPAVIRSARRFTYQEALAVIQRPAPGDAIERMLQQAHALAQQIRRARFKAGSLDLDFPDSKIRLDEQGRLLRVETNRERRFAPVDRGIHAAGQRGGGGAVDGLAPSGGLSRA